MEESCVTLFFIVPFHSSVHTFFSTVEFEFLISILKFLLSPLCSLASSVCHNKSSRSSYSPILIFTASRKDFVLIGGGKTQSAHWRDFSLAGVIDQDRIPDPSQMQNVSPFLRVAETRTSGGMQGILPIYIRQICPISILHSLCFTASWEVRLLRCLTFRDCQTKQFFLFKAWLFEIWVGYSKVSRRQSRLGLVGCM